MNVAELSDIEAIKKLKARYFRLMDAHNWAEFGDVFTRDAVMRGGDQEVTGRTGLGQVGHPGWEQMKGR